MKRDRDPEQERDDEIFGQRHACLKQHDGADYHLTPAVLAHIRRLGLYNADTVHPTRHAHNEAP